MGENLQPGTITTLGQLRPGDVGEWLESDRRFIVQGVSASGRSLVHYDRGSEAPYMAHHPVRYLGRGRIEPARIVMEGEPDRVAELEEQVRTLREYTRECADNFDCDNYAHRYQTFCRQCEARAVLAATAPKEESCTT